MFNIIVWVSYLSSRQGEKYQKTVLILSPNEINCHNSSFI